MGSKHKYFGLSMLAPLLLALATFSAARPHKHDHHVLNSLRQVVRAIKGNAAVPSTNSSEIATSRECDVSASSAILLTSPADSEVTSAILIVDSTLAFSPDLNMSLPTPVSPFSASYPTSSPVGIANVELRAALPSNAARITHRRGLHHHPKHASKGKTSITRLNDHVQFFFFLRE